MAREANCISCGSLSGPMVLYGWTLCGKCRKAEKPEPAFLDAELPFMPKEFRRWLVEKVREGVAA